MEFVAYIAYVLIGTLAGFLAGLLGIGGGLVTVPLLALVFHFIGLPQAHLMHLAIGTSLSAMCLTALSSALAHHIRGSVLWELIKVMVLGLVLGSIAGALLAHLISSLILEIFFGLMIIAVGIYFYKDHVKIKTEIQPVSKYYFTFWGFGIAFFSNLLGVGGGIFTVPLLVAHHYPEKKAIGTSVASAMIVSFLGALAYLYFGFHEVQIPHVIGYLYLPAFIGVSIASVIAAPFGAKWAYRLSEKKLRRWLAIFLIVTGLFMVF